MLWWMPVIRYQVNIKFEATIGKWDLYYFSKIGSHFEEVAQIFKLKRVRRIIEFFNHLLNFIAHKTYLDELQNNYKTEKDRIILGI